MVTNNANSDLTAKKQKEKSNTDDDGYCCYCRFLYRCS